MFIVKKKDNQIHWNGALLETEHFAIDFFLKEVSVHGLKKKSLVF
jgi:hypothetical protein